MSDENRRPGVSREEFLARRKMDEEGPSEEAIAGMVRKQLSWTRTEKQKDFELLCFPKAANEPNAMIVFVPKSNYWQRQIPFLLEYAGETQTGEPSLKAAPGKGIYFAITLTRQQFEDASAAFERHRNGEMKDKFNVAFKQVPDLNAAFEAYEASAQTQRAELDDGVRNIMAEMRNGDSSQLR